MYQGDIKNIKDKLDDYIKTFGDDLPLIMVKDSITSAQLIDVIENAISEEIRIPIDSFIFLEKLEEEII